MKFTLRPYQEEASLAAVCAFKNKDKNGILICPTGSGKSLIIADIAAKLNDRLLILQPSKEILEQNFAKMQSYGVDDIGIFSASVGIKDIKRITFATIGSIVNRMEEFTCFRNVLIDECHLVKPSDGMYKRFIDNTKRIVVGLTATPYRLYSNSFGAQLRFITRTRPSVFKKVLYCCQIQDILKQGYLANLKYFDLTELKTEYLKSNSTGADWTDESVRNEYIRTNFNEKLYDTIQRLLHTKNGIPRNGILVFTRFIEEAEILSSQLGECAAVVTGDTPKKEREEILRKFKNGEIKVVCNAMVLTTGFDYPELDTIVLARPTKSLALYYQMVGRAIRPYKGKEGWIVDLSGTFKTFGKVESLVVEDPNRNGKWIVTSNGRQLTNTNL